MIKPEQRILKLSTVVLVSCMVLFALPAPATAQVSACRPTDSKTVSFLGNIMFLATAPPSNSYAADERLIMGLGASDSTQILLVADSTTCSQARAAYATALGRDPSTVSVIVVQVADKYVVVDPSAPAGEWWLAKTFDSVFVKVKDFAW